MNDVTLQHEDGKPVVRFERHFAHSPERVWRALTDEAELAAWYPTRVRIDPVAGGSISFAFPGGEPFYGEVLAAERPRALAFTTRDDVLRWDLSADGDGTTVVLRHSVSDPPHTPYTAAGFHISLNQLDALLNGGAESVERTEMPPPEDLVDRYRAALGV